MHHLWIYLLIINALAFLLMRADKKRAQRNMERIPEKELLSIAVFGGSIGVLSGVFLFRHKTKKPLFLIGVAILPAIHMFLFILFEGVI